MATAKHMPKDKSDLILTFTGLKLAHAVNNGVQNCWKYVTGEDVLGYRQVCRWTSTDWVPAEWWLPAFDLWLYHWLYSQGSISKRGVIIFWLKGLR